MDNGKITMRLLLTALCVSLALGCHAQNEAIEAMKSSKQAANERARKELVAYMSLETIFPDPQARAFAEAAGKGDLKKVDALAAKGVDVNLRGARNATPLFWAMRSGSLNGFKKLLALGADPNVIFDDGGTVMHWAVQHKNEGFLRAALAHGGDPNLMAGQLDRSPLFEALGDRRDQIDILLDAGADVNITNKFGTTPVMLAAGRGSFDVVYKLLNHGADYDTKNHSGQALVDMIADVRGRMDPKHEMYQWMQKVIRWLEERGVRVPKTSD